MKTLNLEIQNYNNNNRVTNNNFQISSNLNNRTELYNFARIKLRSERKKFILFHFPS